MDSLTDLLDFFDEITFISYFTVYPELKDIPEYLAKFNDLLLEKENTELYLLGKKLSDYNNENVTEKISIFNSIENLAIGSKSRASTSLFCFFRFSRFVLSSQRKV